MAIGDGYVYLMISIHALREEGDDTAAASSRPLSDFYPRPPRGGRHGRCVQLLNQRIISIHALREEGDSITSEDLRCIRISIHALREEGDREEKGPEVMVDDFYPHPPRGGRHLAELQNIMMRAISIHALREEGDYTSVTTSPTLANFYPRPPRGGRLII